ncbi:MAG: carbohydrate-binding domain-containing protein [Thermoplasmata archaeon]|nr:carbohydrate-binding domain-containing protein [Thermoplasmata archaeon]
MEGKTTTIIAIVALVAIILGGVALISIGQDNGGNSGNEGEVPSGGDSGSDDSGSSDITSAFSVNITCTKGTEGCYTITQSGSEYTITFSGITENTAYSISGEMTGNIIIDATDGSGNEFDFELDLEGFTINSTKNVPIMVIVGDEFELSAKNGTSNYVYDKRAAVSDTSDEKSGAIHCECDMTLKGKGSLYVESSNNNGIHGKKDLEVKNLYLYVNCVDNALKGDDSVTIVSGQLELYSKSGDGIKTEDSDVSSKGNQRGTLTINSDGDSATVVTIYAYCDGIDAAYDVVVEETASSIVLNIYTYLYAYSTTSSNVLGAAGGWSGGPMPGGNMSLSNMGGGPDSPGNPFANEGNSSKVSFSCKGIKADNAISIVSGTVTISSYDDGLHANKGTLDSATGTGNITISGGTVNIASKDDGMHADGTLTISGGTVEVTESYEALEGTKIVMTDGSVSLRCSDDGVNATGSGLTLSGGYLYVYAGGDGLDSNSGSIAFDGTNVFIVSTSGGNSAIDSDYSYTYTKGIVLAICPTGMTQEITSSSAYKNSGTSKTMSLSSGATVIAKVSGTVMAAIKMPVAMNNAVVVYLGSTSAELSTGSQSGLNDDGVYYKA